MNDRELPQRLREMSWPQPSDALRARVLSASSVVTRRVTWSDRMWFSRAWRLAGAATFLALIAIAPVVDRSGATTVASRPQTFGDPQVTNALNDMGQRIGLPGDVLSSLTRRAALSEARRSMTEQRTLETFEREAFDAQGGGK